MHEAVRRMLEKYPLETMDQAEHALKEILQEIALFGLWRSGLFNKAAFYGGTALRILYGLERFSEDLDFSLISPEKEFSFAPFKKTLEEEIRNFGFDLTFEPRENRPDRKTNIETAFLKGNTYTQMVLIDVPDDLLDAIHKNKIVKIKLEADFDPPPHFTTELKTVLRPIPFSVRTFGLPWMFAGKMHAVLCRRWENRVKGRDWYDMTWYLSKGTRLSLDHLEARMRQTGHWNIHNHMSTEDFRSLYCQTVRELDVEKAIQDVAPFLPQSTVNYIESVWSREFFLSLGEHFSFHETDQQGPE
jgi:predicted nucleotidyltransferase component of viral defense system